MSEAIKQMLRDREKAGQMHEAARRRAIIAPIKRSFAAGFNLMRQERSKMDAKAAAFQEGCDTGLFDAGCDLETAWRISDARKTLLDFFEAEP